MLAKGGVDKARGTALRAGTNRGYSQRACIISHPNAAN
jgi:hypothetical protein